MNINLLVEILLMVLLIIFVILYMNARNYKNMLMKDVEKIQDESEKLKEFHFMLAQWIYDYLGNAKLSDYLFRNGYKTVAIYGAAIIGELLYKQMKKENIGVKYFIDRNSDILTAEITMYSFDDEIPDVDIVIVTAVHYYDEIKHALNSRHFKSVSLKDVVCGV